MYNLQAFFYHHSYMILFVFLYRPWFQCHDRRSRLRWGSVWHIWCRNQSIPTTSMFYHCIEFCTFQFYDNLGMTVVSQNQTITMLDEVFSCDQAALRSLITCQNLQFLASMFVCRFVTCQNLHFGKYVRWSCLLLAKITILASMLVGHVCLFVSLSVCLYGNFTKSQERLSQSSPNLVTSKH